MQIRELSCKTLQIPIKTIKPPKTGKKSQNKTANNSQKIAALILDEFSSFWYWVFEWWFSFMCMQLWLNWRTLQRYICSLWVSEVLTAAEQVLRGLVPSQPSGSFVHFKHLGHLGMPLDSNFSEEDLKLCILQCVRGGDTSRTDPLYVNLCHSLRSDQYTLATLFIPSTIGHNRLI